jgi:hypothetical protein
MRRIAILLVITSATCLSALQAQSAPARGPDGSMRTITPGIEVLPYLNRPFSGTDTIVKTLPIEGGGTITTSETSKIARDSQGRLYRERHHFAAVDVDPEKTLYEFYVLDPISHTHTACTIATHQCTRTSYHPRFSYPVQPTGAFDAGRRFLTREDLGQQSIDNLPTIGTREITTIAPATVGNDKELTLTREFWYSPDLRTNLSAIRKDPREGTQAIHLNVLSRDEPDPSTFAVPAGYTVQDGLQVTASSN